MMDIDERQRRKEYIESLTPTERGVFADMVMRSLRGSWRSPRKRAYIIQWIGQTGDVEYYDAAKLTSLAESYFAKIGRGSPDGRFWRGIYEEADVDIVVLPERKVRELSSHIPDDLTWDDRRIGKEYGYD